MLAQGLLRRQGPSTGASVCLTARIGAGLALGRLPFLLPWLLRLPLLPLLLLGPPLLLRLRLPLLWWLLLRIILRHRFLLVIVVLDPDIAEGGNAGMNLR